MIYLDVDYVFDRLRGPRGILDLFDKHVPDHNLSYPQVQMWKQRGKVARDYVAALIYALWREGVPIGNCFKDEASDEEFM